MVLERQARRATPAHHVDQRVQRFCLAALLHLVLCVATETAIFRYSYRSAAIGSSRAAFSAGHMPKNRPVPVATVNPVITLHIGTVDGRLGTKVRIARLSSQPIRIPTIPPNEVSVIASS